MIQWLLESCHEINEPPELFLSEAEQVRYDSFRIEKRRSDWLLGRWAAKRLLQSVLLQQGHAPVARPALEILNDASHAPFVKLYGETLPCHLSISHCHGWALCTTDDDPLGVDLEWIEPRDCTFVEDYFTVTERAHINAAPRAQRDCLVTGIWSAKEAVLKTLHAGLSIDTRAIEISGAPFTELTEDWMPFRATVQLNDAAPLAGWCRGYGNFVLTLVTIANDAPARFPTSPENFTITLGAEHGQGHGGLHRRIADATQHHTRRHQRN
ncbi:MAG: 4'-phosphopantetheinyl transferase superfamily protein [Anaerolineae bacterium]|nr:4'-phosphopantetheinyl transferase superfamily protein [Anaerolineae bacterium]